MISEWNGWHFPNYDLISKFRRELLIASLRRDKQKGVLATAANLFDRRAAQNRSLGWIRVQAGDQAGRHMDHGHSNDSLRRSFPISRMWNLYLLRTLQ